MAGRRLALAGDENGESIPHREMVRPLLKLFIRGKRPFPEDVSVVLNGGAVEGESIGDLSHARLMPLSKIGADHGALGFFPQVGGE